MEEKNHQGNPDTAKGTNKILEMREPIKQINNTSENIINKQNQAEEWILRVGDKVEAAVHTGISKKKWAGRFLSD